ncbi:MAG: hypothetical protein UV78_C0023G0018 [Parcubacteria group bacterium GW2011_GWA2_43_17]|nr:MAG: hypothetical protein UV78_C0023G0018 [Parcubacteria group bacterium GW2011_GWA2_43_17]
MALLISPMAVYCKAVRMGGVAIFALREELISVAVV